MKDPAYILISLLMLGFILAVFGFTLALILLCSLVGISLLIWTIRTMLEAKRSRDNGQRLVARPEDYEDPYQPHQ